MKTRSFVLAVLLLVACSEKPVKNISTTEAMVKYGRLIKNQTFFVYPELREHPIKWYDSIPERKIQDVYKQKRFVLTAQPGEFYVFQIGLWALKQEIGDVNIEFSDLKDDNGDVISASLMTCFNKGGTDFRGKPFTKKIIIPAGRVHALWMGIDLDKVTKGKYKGSIQIIVNGEKQIVPLVLKVDGEVVSDHGYNEGSH